MIEENTVVVTGATLTIEPGTVVRFGKQGGLEIRGGIIAEGLEDNKIVFTSMDDLPGGDFDPAIVIPIDLRPWYLTVGDPDNDGEPEIVTVNNDTATLSIIEWNGNGFFVTSTLTVPGNNTQCDIADIDNDGDQDIVVADAGFGLSLIPWDVAGFGPLERISVPGNPEAVLVADIDHDGLNDLLVGKVAEDNSVLSWLKWLGNGFSAPEHLNGGNGSQELEFDDINGDGLNDILAVNAFSSDLSLLLGQGDHYAHEHTFPFGYSRNLVVSDLDGDTDKEILYNGIIYEWDFDTLVGTDAMTLNEYRGIHETYSSSTDNQWDHYTILEDLDGDGDIDLAMADSDSSTVRISLWNRSIGTSKAYEGIWIRSTSVRAGFKNCEFKFAPTVDESDNASFNHCIWDRTGGDSCLSSLHGSNPVIGCRAFGNGGGDGILVGNQTLIDCVSTAHSGTGLIGESMTRCISTDNGGSGIQSATGLIQESTSFNNGGWGINSDSDISNCIASFNELGIRGVDITNCEAKGNRSVGIDSSGVAIGCLAAENDGAGIQGSVNECIVVRNQEGVSTSSTVFKNFIAENEGNGITGGALLSCSVVGHSRAGAVDSISVNNCWIVNNAEEGLVNPGSLTNSTVRNNMGSGVTNAGKVNGSILYGNGGQEGYDYEDMRLSTILLEVDVSGNYWGPETTSFMNAHLWGSNANVPRVFDFFDSTDRTAANYENHLESGKGAGPDLEPPGFLLNVAPNLSDAANVGLVTFILEFNEPMDTSVQPVVT
ncbi:MAG: VCBS repeat-containing protein, partial [Candidatus Omnitrophica bacterium]|nr:VCBS repeat-containing protein [Candidatus Omnitrophota bacterium]